MLLHFSTFDSLFMSLCTDRCAPGYAAALRDFCSSKAALWNCHNLMLPHWVGVLESLFSQKPSEGDALLGYMRK